MAVVGSLVIGMSADYGSLGRDLMRGAKSVSKFASDVTQKLGGVGGILAGIGLGLGVDAFKDFVMGSAEALDKSGDFADRLGITRDALESVRFATMSTGSEIEDLDKGLEKLSVNIGKAATEGGSAAEKFSELGLDAKALSKVGIDQAFLDISDAISKIGDPAKQAAAATELFGKSGAKLVNTLREGRSGLSGFIDEFLSFGSVSEAQRAKVGTLFDSIDRFTGSISALGQKLAVALAPAIEAITKFGTSAIQWLGRGIDYLAGFAGGTEALTARIGEQSAALNRAATAATILENAEESRAEKAIESGQDLIRVLEEQLDLVGMTSREQMLTKALRAGVDEATVRKGIEISEAIDAAEAAAERTKQLDDVARRLNDPTSTALGRFAQSIQDIRDVASQGKITPEQAAKASKAAESEFFGESRAARAGAAEFGSQEARSAVLDFLGMGSAKPLESTAKNTDATAKEAKRSADLLSQLIGEVRRMQGPAVAVDL